MGLWDDIALKAPGVAMHTIFDIGANVGQSAKEYREQFPDADIYSFEPVPATFARLQKKTRGDNVKAFNLGFGRNAEPVVMSASPLSSSNRIKKNPSDLTIDLQLAVGDQFCAEHGIERINFLKIDTEGHDLDVAAGFTAMFRSGRIDFCQMEVGLNRLNTRHVSLERAIAAMRFVDCDVFRFSEVTFERNDAALARRCDVVFVSNAISTATSKQ